MSDVLARLEQANIEGISPSLPHTQGRLWRDGENVIFNELSVQPIPGQRILFPKVSSSPVRGILEAEDSAGRRKLFVGNLTNLYSWTATGGVITEGTSYTLSVDATAARRAEFWSLKEWDNWILATNGKDAPQIRTTATGFRATTATDRPFTTAEIVASLGEFAIYINTSNGGKVVEWSDTDAPESLIQSDVSNAGSMHIRELENEIIAAERLGPGYGLYSSDSMSLLVHTGGDEVFSRRPLITGLGAVGKKAVCAVGGLNYGLSFRGLWETDGNSFNALDDPEVHDEIFTNANFDQLSKAVAWYDKLLDTVVFFFPGGTSLINDRAIAFNRKSRNFTKFGFGRSYAVEASIFPFGITGDDEGNVYGQSVPGAPSSAPGSPVLNSPTVVLQAGIGTLGFGQLGVGGYYAGNG